MTRPLLMGIVNVTPDSFFDGGDFFDPDKAIAHGLKLLEEGADLLDIGGESTRPGAQALSVDEEMRRVVPVIKELAKTGKMISIDTRNAPTMRAAHEAGANFLNDISTLRSDESLELAARFGAGICLMHMQGDPQTMQKNPVYSNVVEDVFSFLDERVAACVEAGIAKDKVYADVGIGFGKTLAHNLTLLKDFDRFHDLGVKLLLGASRKKFIETISGPSGDRLGGSLAVALWGANKGAHILRVHDVAQTKQALDVWKTLSLSLPGSSG